MLAISRLLGALANKFGQASRQPCKVGRRGRGFGRAHLNVAAYLGHVADGKIDLLDRGALLLGAQLNFSGGLGCSRYVGANLLERRPSLR